MSSPSYTAPPKDPADIEDYGLDCSAWLGAETIVGRTVVPDDPTLTISGVTHVGAVVRWRAAGGTVGTNHTMTVRVTSNAGRIVERTVSLPVREL